MTHAVWVNIIETIGVTLSLPSIFLLLYMILFKMRFHINFRILLTILCLSFLLYDSARLTLLIFTFIYGHDIPKQMFFSTSATFGIASVSYSASFSMLGAERCFATYRAENYEKRSGIIGRIVTVSLALLNICIPVCIVFTFKGSMIAGTLAVFSEALLLFFLSLSVYTLNHRLINILSRLTKKFQVKENIEASSALLLISLVWLSLEIPALICLLVIIIGQIAPDTPSYHLFLNLYYLFNATYTLLFPWLFIMRVARYKETLTGWFSRNGPLLSREEREKIRKEKDRIREKNETNTYFNSIDSQWGTIRRSLPLQHNITNK